MVSVRDNFTKINGRNSVKPIYRATLSGAKTFCSYLFVPAGKNKRSQNLKFV